MSWSAPSVEPARVNAPSAARWHARLPLLMWAAIIAIASLLVAPLYCYQDDMDPYWVPWQLATAGWQPWNAYTVKNCNYPPVVLYLLTVQEQLRSLFGIDPGSRWNWTLIKIPNIAAHVAGAFLLRSAVARFTAPLHATAIALTWLLSPALFVNAAVWGQWDVVFCLFMLLGVFCCARGAYGGSGFWLGVAIATKVQMVFALPVYALFLLLGGGWRATSRAAAGTAIALVLLFAPVAAGGRLPEALRVYTASVDTFPARSLNAWNHWTILNGVEVRLLKKEKAQVTSDRRLVLPGVVPGFSYKHLGQLLYGSYLLAVLVAVARRRDVRTFIEAIPLSGVAMFMLATQMHERYILPPAVLMTPWLLLDRPFRYHFWYWTLSAAANQAAVLWLKEIPQNAFQAMGGVISALNVMALIHLSYNFFRPRNERRFPDPESQAVEPRSMPRSTAVDAASPIAAA